MARKRYDVKAQAEMELNMTPMIDIVFLLIIFFMTVTELSKLDAIAAIQLPVADQAYVDQDIPDKIVINLKKGKKGPDEKPEIYFKNKPVTIEELRRHLHIAAIITREGEATAEGPPAASQPIVIRADRDLRYHFVQDVMLECANEGLYRVSLVARQVER